MPADVALVCFDDPADGDLLDPPMTALGRHYGDLGELAAGLLLRALRGGSNGDPRRDPGAARARRAPLLRLLIRPFFGPWDLTNGPSCGIHCISVGIDSMRRDTLNRELGIGVIGLGWMGRVHSSSYRRVLEHFPDLGVTPRLVVASDVSASRRAHAERIGFERTVEDWRAVIEDPAVDLISVTVPNAMHREVAVAAAEAGKHIWVEKPVGRGAADTEAVLRRRAARRA